MKIIEGEPPRSRSELMTSEVVDFINKADGAWVLVTEAHPNRSAAYSWALRNPRYEVSVLKNDLDDNFSVYARKRP